MFMNLPLPQDISGNPISLEDVRGRVKSSPHVSINNPIGTSHEIRNGKAYRVISALSYCSSGMVSSNEQVSAMLPPLF